MTNSSKKVILTKAQNVALASYLFHYGAKKTLEQSFVVDSFAAPYASLNALSWNTIEQAVQYGWDVAEDVRYKVGDAIVTPKGHVLELARDLGGSEYFANVLYSADYGMGQSGRVDVQMEGVRKATASETLFARLGRREYDFREGDIFVDADGEHFEINEYEITTSDVIRWLDIGDCTGVIPVGSLVKYEGGSN